MPLGRIVYCRLFPELQLFYTLAARNQAMDRAQKTLSRTLGYGLVMLAWFVCIEAVMLTVQAFTAPLWAACVGFTVAISAPVSTGFWLFRRRIQRSLRRQLIDRGVPVCLKCGYQLRGLMDPRCPECGEAFDERLLELCRPDDTPPSTGEGE